MAQSHLVVFCLLFILVLVVCKTADIGIETNLEQLQGSWCHSLDEEAIITIRGNVWKDKYKGLADDVYAVSILDYLPKYSSDSIPSEFIELTSSFDTIHYELLSATKENMSLLHFPTGKLHLYKRIE